MKKNIEWLKKEIATEMIELEPNRKERWSDVKYQTLRDVAQKIYQLEEPEVLSQEWIDKNKTSIDRKLDGTPIYKVREELLQNLIIPKQELPAIPKYVGEFIEEVKASGDRLDDAFSILRGIYHQSKTADWVAKENRNSETFARAWLDGYEVEEEPLYYVINNQNYFLLAKDKGHGFVFSTGGNSRLGGLKNSLVKFELTEQEIKDYDSRYWTFAVKVEEVE